MRRFSIFILLFSFAAGGFAPLQAQPAPTSGREPVRSEWRGYPSQAEATAAGVGDHRYLHNLTEWTQAEGNFSTFFTVPFEWANRQVVVHVDSATAAYEVLVNGRPVAHNADPCIPAEFNVTKSVHEGRNTLEIKLQPATETAPLESWCTDSQPALGNAWIASRPTLHIRDVLTHTQLNDSGAATADIGLVVKTQSLNPRTSRIHYELLAPNGERIAGGMQSVTLAMRGEDTLHFLATVPDTLLWSPEHPVQCTLQLKTQHEGRYVEYAELPMGFRAIATDKAGQLRLNGRETLLLNCEALPDITRQEIIALREKGFNTLRLKAGPIRPGLYADCDRAGMLVVAQSPVDTSKSGLSRKLEGNPSNDPCWRTYFIERVEDAYHAAKRHPSVVAFALAENSANGICLYESYLSVKRFGDDRPFIYPDGGNEWNNDALKQ